MCWCDNYQKTMTTSILKISELKFRVKLHFINQLPTINHLTVNLLQKYALTQKSLKLKESWFKDQFRKKMHPCLLSVSSDNYHVNKKFNSGLRVLQCKSKQIANCSQISRSSQLVYQVNRLATLRKRETAEFDDNLSNHKKV